MQFNSDSHSLRCPKCQHGMEAVTHNGVTIDRCTNCQGLWFDDDEAQQLKHGRGAEVLDAGSPIKGRDYDMHVDIQCPHCGRPMEKTSDWKQTHVWYEICRNHGIFMDAGEFTDFKHETPLDILRGFIKGKRPV